MGVKDARDGKVFQMLAVSLATPYMAPTDITHNEATSLFFYMLFTRFNIKSFKGDSSAESRAVEEERRKTRKRKNGKSINATKQIDKEA